VVRNTETKQVWIRDYKTSGRDVQYTLAGYLFSLQCRIYRLLAHSTGYSPEGFILDILQSPSIKFCKKDKTFDDYVKRVKLWYAEKGDKSVRSFSIRYAEPPMPEELEKVLTFTWSYVIRPPLAHLFRRDVTGHSCKRYERLCDYYQLCSSDEAVWPVLIASNYEVVPPEETKGDTDDDSTQPASDEG
jgi:hypothetical protein